MRDLSRIALSLLVIALVTLLLAGCGGPPAIVGSDCGSVYGAEVYAADCASAVTAIKAEVDLYRGQWAALSLDGWTINIVPDGYLGPHGGMTYHAERRIDIDVVSYKSLPHELEHARLGPSSDEHCGWVSDGFAAWESTFGRDEAAYIESTCPGSP